MKKWTALLFSLIMLVSLAASCGGSTATQTTASTSAAAKNDDDKDKDKQEETDEASEATESKKENTSSNDGNNVISFWNLGVESPDKEYYQSSVDAFNANTESGYKIETTNIQNDTYKEKLVIAMSSSQCPDLYTSWSGGPMNEYIDAGFAQPITELVNASDIKDKIMDAAWAQASYKDEIYALPILNVSISGVFYNTEMFEKYDLSVPETVTELEAVCDTLVENGITPFALANASKWTGSMYFMSLATRKGGLDPFNAAADGSGSFENESYEYAGTKIQEWVNKNYFPDGVNSLSEDDGQAKQLMYQETAAMLLCGSWYTGTFQSDSPEFYEKIDWFSFPAVEGSDADISIQIGTIGDQFLHFNCEGEKLEAAFEFAGYYSKDESVELLLDSAKIPIVKIDAGKITDPVNQKILQAALNASSTQLWYDQYLPPAVGEVHKDTCQEIFGLTQTPEEANKALNDAMQAYLKG